MCCIFLSFADHNLVVIDICVRSFANLIIYQINAQLIEVEVVYIVN